MSTIQEAKELICELCATYYTQGWVSGTGGGMSIKVGDDIVMAPSGAPNILDPLLRKFLAREAKLQWRAWQSGGLPHAMRHDPSMHAMQSTLCSRLKPASLSMCTGVPKERMQPSDMFVLDAAGNVKEAPAARPPPYKPPKLTECAPLFQSVSDLEALARP